MTTTRPTISRAAIVFVFSTLVTSWAAAAVFLELTGGRNRIATLIFSVFYMFFPLLNVIAVQRFVSRERPGSNLGFSLTLNRWYAVALILPVVIALATFMLSLALPTVSFAPHMEGMVARFAAMIKPDKLAIMNHQAERFGLLLLPLTIFQGMIAGGTVNAVAAFGEEAGWRGLLYRELRPMGFWNSSLIIGIIWGIWHAPLTLNGHNYPQHPVIGVAMMTLFCILLTPPALLIRERSGSVIAAAVFHGTINGVGGAAIIFVRGGSDLTIGITGAAGFAILALVDMVIVWRYPTRDAGGATPRSQSAP